MSNGDKLQAIRKSGREAMPLRAGRGAGFHGRKTYDRREEDERWRRFVWQEGGVEIENVPPSTETGIDES